MRLSDQTGALVDLHEQRAGRPALQQVAPALAVIGVALFAISYDSVEILRNFATAHGITYHLLSDEGSHAMRGLGLINDRVQENHAAYGIKPNPRHVNLPYPGVFVLDRDGVVTQKRFYWSYRERDTGSGLIAQALGIFAESSAPVVATNGPVVTARAWLDSPTYVFFQRVIPTSKSRSLLASTSTASRPATGSHPCRSRSRRSTASRWAPRCWPSPRRFTRPGFNDRLWVDEGIVRGMVPLTFAAAPGGGDHMVNVTVRYQACDDASYLVPSSVQLAVPVRETALVGRSLPSPTSKP